MDTFLTSPTGLLTPPPSQETLDFQHHTAQKKLLQEKLTSIGRLSSLGTYLELLEASPSKPEFISAIQALESPDDVRDVVNTVYHVLNILYRPVKNVELRKGAREIFVKVRALPHPDHASCHGLKTTPMSSTFDEQEQTAMSYEIAHVFFHQCLPQDIGEPNFAPAVSIFANNSREVYKVGCGQDLFNFVMALLDAEIAFARERSTHHGIFKPKLGRSEALQGFRDGKDLGNVYLAEALDNYDDDDLKFTLFHLAKALCLQPDFDAQGDMEIKSEYTGDWKMFMKVSKRSFRCEDPESGRPIHFLEDVRAIGVHIQCDNLTVPIGADKKGRVAIADLFEELVKAVKAEVDGQACLQFRQTKRAINRMARGGKEKNKSCAPQKDEVTESVQKVESLKKRKMDDNSSGIHALTGILNKKESGNTPNKRLNTSKRPDSMIENRSQSAGASDELVDQMQRNKSSNQDFQDEKHIPLENKWLTKPLGSRAHSNTPSQEMDRERHAGLLTPKNKMEKSIRASNFNVVPSPLNTRPNFSIQQPTVEDVELAQWESALDSMFESFPLPTGSENDGESIEPNGQYSSVNPAELASDAGQEHDRFTQTSALSCTNHKGPYISALPTNLVSDAEQEFYRYISTISSVDREAQAKRSQTLLDFIEEAIECHVPETNAYLLPGADPSPSIPRVSSSQNYPIINGRIIGAEDIPMATPQQVIRKIGIKIAHIRARRHGRIIKRFNSSGGGRPIKTLGN